MINREQLLIKAKKLVLGTSWRSGLIYKIVLYVLLILFGFIFVLPLISMVSYAFMSPDDVVNPLVKYLPTVFYFDNFITAVKVLDFWKSLFNTLLVAVLPSLIQCVSVSLIGYGIARFNFKGKNVLIALILMTFIIPPQTTMIPQLLLYVRLKMGNILAFIVPALLGQGLKSAIFILIFFQFFKSLPASLEEAAKIDGAGRIRIFIFIAAPLALSAYILTFLFSFVWYFNETVLTALFLGTGFRTLPLQLQSFQSSFLKLNSTVSDAGRSLNEAVYMAGTFVSIIPLLIIYFLTQRFFVESIDKAGITGE